MQKPLTWDDIIEALCHIPKDKQVLVLTEADAAEYTKCGMDLKKDGAYGVPVIIIGDKNG